MASNQNEQNSEEQQFSIQPHPAKDNYDPSQFVEPTPGLGSAPTLQGGKEASAYGGRGGAPHVISSEVAEGLEPPKSREELQALSAKLNE
ncbi:hypothetical protein JCM11641_005170 [Rhodosporidiobolus odoratus]